MGYRLDGLKQPICSLTVLKSEIRRWRVWFLLGALSERPSPASLLSPGGSAAFLGS